MTQQITALPTPPSRQDPVNFPARGDAFMAALPAFATEANLLASEVNTNSTSANASAILAEGYAAGAQAAAASVGASMWNAPTNYTTGTVVWSPVNGRAYRRKSPGGVTATDPSLDVTNWYDVVTLQSLPTISIASNMTAVNGRRYLIESAIELILPSEPAIGDIVAFTDLSKSFNATINPQSFKIRGVLGIMRLNALYASEVMTYSGSTHGWV